MAFRVFASGSCSPRLRSLEAASVSVCACVVGKGGRGVCEGGDEERKLPFVLVFTLFNNRRIGNRTLTFYWPLLYMKGVMKKESRYIP